MPLDRKAVDIISERLLREKASENMSVDCVCLPSSQLRSCHLFGVSCCRRLWLPCGLAA